MRFKLRQCYHLRIHNIEQYGITKENLANYLSHVSKRFIIAKEVAPRTKKVHIQACVEKEHVDLGKPQTRPMIKYIQKKWPQCTGNENIGCPLVEKGLLRFMAYLLKADDDPLIHQVDKTQLAKAKLISYKENKNGEMKEEIKKAKEDWLVTEPQGQCSVLKCIGGNHQDCKIAHTRQLYNAIGQIYNKYQKDLRISTQQMICRPTCKRKYPELIRNQARRANNSMWGEYD